MIAWELRLISMLPTDAGGYCVWTDYAVGFGGKFGVQADRQDKSAVGWDHHEQVAKHASQADQARGKLGIETGRIEQDAPAEKVGTNYVKAKPDIGMYFQTRHTLVAVEFRAGP